MVVLLGIGVINLGAMAVVAAAITVERLAPKPARVARVTGVVAIAAGGLFKVRALGLA